jgi:hypothetical protein
LLQRLAAGECRSAVRWTAFYSNLDALVMPPSSAMLPESAMGATNVLVKDVGHLSIMLSSRLARGIVDVLETSAVVEAAS